jgi:hypothetical protein
MDQLATKLDGPALKIGAMEASRWLNELLMSTALATSVYAEFGDREKAAQCLELHGRLRQLAGQVAPDTVAGKVASLRLLMTDSNALLGLATAAQLKEWLTQNAGATDEQFIALVRARATADRAVVLGADSRGLPTGWPLYTYSPPSYYPTLGWRSKRAIALHLDAALTAIEQDLASDYLGASRYNAHNDASLIRSGWGKRYLHEYLHTAQLQLTQLLLEQELAQAEAPADDDSPSRFDSPAHAP